MLECDSLACRGVRMKVAGVQIVRVYQKSSAVHIDFGQFFEGFFRAYFTIFVCLLTDFRVRVCLNYGLDNNGKALGDIL